MAVRVGQSAMYAACPGKAKLVKGQLDKTDNDVKPRTSDITCGQGIGVYT